MEVVREDRCRHPGCGCPPDPPFRPFCSAYCQNVVRDAARESAQTDPAGACACGHPACTAALGDEARPVQA